MIAHRRGRVVVIVDEVDPFPGRSARPIRLPPRVSRPGAVAIRAQTSTTDQQHRREG